MEMHYLMEMLYLGMEMLCLCLGPCLSTLVGVLVSWGVGILICRGLYYAFLAFTPLIS